MSDGKGQAGDARAVVRFRVGECRPDPSRRLVHCAWGRHGTVVRGHDGQRTAYEISAASVAFDAVQARRVPLLWNHGAGFDDFLGIVQAGWVEDGRINMIAKLGRSARADLILSNLRDDIPYACSVGVTHGPSSVRRDGLGDYLLCETFEVSEMSICHVHRPWDAAATVNAGDYAYELLMQRQAIDAAELERQRNALDPFFLDRLRARLPGMASAVAARVGLLRPDGLEAALRRELEAFAADTRPRAPAGEGGHQ